jgi:LysM repeat protein
MLDSVTTRAVTVSSTAKAKHAAVETSTVYTVRSGDTLSKIAQRYYDKANDWQYLAHVNDKTVSNPDLIFVSQKLVVPVHAPADYTLPDYHPRHLKPATAAVTATTTAASGNYSDASPASSRGSGSGGSAGPGGAAQGSGSSSGGGSGTIGGSSDGGTVVVQSAPTGAYSCSALESLWDQAGGNPADAFTAAEIATAESGGNPNAISPTDDYGLWQINASNGALATLNPYANAKSAIILSDDGTNWDAWTTYRTGAYNGRC